MATIIHVDGTTEELLPVKVKGKKKPKLTLEMLQKAVGGYIAPLKLGDGRTLYCNEEGMPRGLPVNVSASSMFGYRLLGDVVITEKQEF